MRRGSSALTNCKSVVMVGPDWSAHGGIASVIASYRDYGLFDEWPVLFLPTHTEGTRLDKLRVAASALCRFVVLLFRKKVGVLHVHGAVHKSFFRKAMFMSLALVGNVPYFFSPS